MVNRFKYDYYNVTVPSYAPDDMDAMAHQAINEARERARLYCMPCEWQATPLHVGVDEVSFRVRRKRNKRAS